MARIVVGIIYLLSVFVHHAFGQFSVDPSKDYMMCRPISGVFATETTQDGAYPVLRGPEGRPGIQGGYGSKGRPGTANYDKVEQIVNGGLQEIYDKLYALEKEVETFPVAYGGGKPRPAPTRSPEQIANEKACLEKFKSPISIDSMCYNILGGNGLLWRHDIAQTTCETLGGNLADLETKEVYTALYNLADKRYSTLIQAWTGMRYEDEKLLQRDNDTIIPYAKWGSGYPRRSYSSYYSRYDKVYIIFETSSHGRRLLNARSSDRKSYAVCSYNLNGNSTTVPSSTTPSDVTTASSVVG